MNLTPFSCLISNPPVSLTSNLISLDGYSVGLNLYEYPPCFGVAIISMPSSSNSPAAADAAADDDDCDPVTAYLCDVAFPLPAGVAAVAFPNKLLLVNPERYA